MATSRSQSQVRKPQTSTQITTKDVAKEINTTISALKIPINVVVESLADYNNYGTVLSHLTQLEKIAQAKEDAIIKPIMQGVNQLRAELKPSKEKLAEAKRDIKAAMDLYRDAENRRAEQQRQQILQDNRLKPETAVKKVEAIVQPTFNNVRRVLVLKITDESQIPREYFDLNQARLKQFLKDGGTVSGAHVEYENITVS